MRAAFRSLAVGALLAATGCRGQGPSPEVRPAPEVVTSASASSAGTAPGAAPAAALTFEAMEADLQRRCDASSVPQSEIYGDRPPDDVSYEKPRMLSRWYNQCGAKVLDEALRAAMKGTPSLPPARPVDLHREQHEWGRWSGAMANLVEEHRWSDLDGGNRQWGELEGLAASTSHHPMQVERLLYLRALTARDVGALAARAHALHAAGERAEATIAAMGKRAAALLPGAALKVPDPKTSPYPILRSQLEEIASLVAMVQTGAGTLGKLSCGWRALAEALGGPPACAREMTLYYYAGWIDEPFH